MPAGPEARRVSSPTWPGRVIALGSVHCIPQGNSAIPCHSKPCHSPLRLLSLGPSLACRRRGPRLSSAWPCPVHRNGFHLVVWKLFSLVLALGACSLHWVLVLALGACAWFLRLMLALGVRSWCSLLVLPLCACPFHWVLVLALDACAWCLLLVLELCSLLVVPPLRVLGAWSWCLSYLLFRVSRCLSSSCCFSLPIGLLLARAAVLALSCCCHVAVLCGRLSFARPSSGSRSPAACRASDICSRTPRSIILMSPLALAPHPRPA
jgi:hypothetical protein